MTGQAERPSPAAHTLTYWQMRDWQSLITRAGLEDLLPSGYTEAIRHVTVFGAPVITSSATSGHWDHRQTRWELE
jgi:hypothetical protein